MSNDIINNDVINNDVINNDTTNDTINDTLNHLFDMLSNVYAPSIYYIIRYSLTEAIDNNYED